MTSGGLRNFATNGKKIIGATTNYQSLLPILNIPAPPKPSIFLKPSSSYIVEGQCIKIPHGFAVNQEVELGVVIGKTCKDVSVENALDYIGGYCVALDMTATCQMKEARSKGLSWSIGKGFDTACPVSRFISKEEIPDPHNVKLFSCVNGDIQQDGNTNEFIFTIPKLIAFISQYMTLEPNDLILTGTPPGMGPVVPGDHIKFGILNVVQCEFTVT